MTTEAQFLAAARRRPPLRAPYTFVPIDKDVVPTPWNTEPDHGRPHREGLCGELTVTWSVETPILIGGECNSEPVRLGAGGPYILPGASLRGMVRSVLEAVTNAHMDLVDDSRFALRDYEAARWQEVVVRDPNLTHIPLRMTNPNGQPFTAKLPLAGWLQKSGKSYSLRKCNYVDVPIVAICSALGLSSTDDWHCLSLNDRMDAIATPGISGVIDLAGIDPALAGKRGTLVVAGLIKSAVDERRAGQPITTNKAKEIAFLDGVVQSWPISQAAVEAFEAVQVEDGATYTGAPEENWSYWATRFKAGDPVPVFFRGDPARAAKSAAKPNEFFMALTRLLRVPYAKSVRDVLESTQTPLANHQLDFVQALFGHVPAKDDADSGGSGRQRAWRSRVRFEIAAPAPGCSPQVLQPRRAVTMKPRASFFPYYLRPTGHGPTVTHPIDWSSDQAKLAGRKRYPARNRAWPQGELPQPPNEERANDQANDVAFLDASPQTPLHFTSRIRFHNLLPAELGGLVWAITLGQHGKTGAPLRHMLGRAKTFGYGQLAASIDTPRIERNDGTAPPALSDCMSQFENHVASLATTAFGDLPRIKTLLATCDPARGGRLDAALRFPEHGSEAEQAKRVLAAYQEIKKRASCRNDNHNRYPLRRARQTVSSDPTSEDFLFLPDYPTS